MNLTFILKVMKSAYKKSIEWLKTNWENYEGQFVVIFDGILLFNSNDFEQIKNSIENSEYHDMLDEITIVKVSGITYLN